MAETEKLIIVRCTNCNNVLFEAEIIEGKVRKKCDRCGSITSIEVNKKPAGREVLKSQ